MRKYIFSFLFITLPILSVQSLTLPSEQPVLVYYQPQTVLELTIDYDEVQTEVGPFYQYSSRYLGTNEVITKAETTFALQSARLRVIAEADTMRPVIVDDKNANALSLTLTPYRTLAGINIESASTSAREKSSRRSERHNAKQEQSETQLMPLLEEQLMASSTAKMAEGAAKQIYRIREMRLNLLMGEVEHAPADGEALQLMLDELDSKEKELTALFVGKRIVKRHHHSIRYTPQANLPLAGSHTTKGEVVLCRFSKHFGVIAADDLSGEAVTLHLTRQAIRAEKNENTQAKSKTASAIYYNLPALAEVSLNYQDELLLQQKLSVAQWGVSVPLSTTLLNRKQQITFNPLTGEITHIY